MRGEEGPKSRALVMNVGAKRYVSSSPSLIFYLNIARLFVSFAYSFAQVRCDSTIEAGIETCSNCRRLGIVCQFSRVPMKRGPSKG